MSAERLKLVRDVSNIVHARIIWDSDRKTQGVPEHWQSHAAAILESKFYRTRDDCDGFALTAAELLLHKGFKPEEVWIEMCQMTDGSYHLVTSVDAEETPDRLWIIDCNSLLPVRKGHLPYKYVRRMSLAKRGEWEAAS